MNAHWRASVALSRVMCGPAGKPLCARVYEARPALWRSAFMICTDMIFAEYEHCARVHRRWVALPTGGIHGPKAGY